MARIMIAVLEDVPVIPGIQVVWWVETAVLPSGDLEDQRPVMVCARFR